MGVVNWAGGTWDCKEEWGVLDRDTVVWTVWKLSFCGHEVVALGCAGEMERGIVLWFDETCCESTLGRWANLDRNQVRRAQSNGLG